MPPKRTTRIHTPSTVPNFIILPMQIGYIRLLKRNINLEALKMIEVILLDKGTAKTIVVVMAVLGFIGAAMAIIGGLAMLFFGGMFLGVEGGGMFAALGSAAAVFMLLWGLISVWIYYKFLTLTNWARIVVIVFAVVQLLSFPIGTVIGALYIYFLAFNNDVKALFK